MRESFRSFESLNCRPYIFFGRYCHHINSNHDLKEEASRIRRQTKLSKPSQQLQGFNNENRQDYKGYNNQDRQDYQGYNNQDRQDYPGYNNQEGQKYPGYNNHNRQEYQGYMNQDGYQARNSKIFRAFLFVFSI